MGNQTLASEETSYSIAALPGRIVRVKVSPESSQKLKSRNYIRLLFAFMYSLILIVTHGVACQIPRSGADLEQIVEKIIEKTIPVVSQNPADLLPSGNCLDILYARG